MWLTVRTLSQLYLHTSFNYHSMTGIHPELIHLDKELSERRDKRVELASRRGTYEINNAMKGKLGVELVEGTPVAQTPIY